MDAWPTTTPSTVAKSLARRFAFERCQVQIPGPLNLVWIFSGVFPHHMSTGLIPQIRRMLGQYSPLSTYQLATVPIPNLPVIVVEKALESLSSSRPPLGGNENYYLYLLSGLNLRNFIPHAV
jgi:hypothetical protein